MEAAAAAREVARRRQAPPVRAVPDVVQRGGEPAPAHGHARGRQQHADVPRVRQGVLPRGQPQGAHHDAREGGERHVSRVRRRVRNTGVC